jgi:hypothetical protein
MKILYFTGITDSSAAPYQPIIPYPEKLKYKSFYSFKKGFFLEYFCKSTIRKSSYFKEK